MSRTYTPPLRSANPPGPSGNFTATEVDNIMTGLAGIANAAKITKFVANQAARLALGSSVQVGDDCVQLDLAITFTLTGSDPSILASWAQVGQTVFGPSGASHSQGLVPDPGPTSGTTRALFEDGTWKVPSGGGGGADGTLQWVVDRPWTPPLKTGFTEFKNHGSFVGIPYNQALGVPTEGAEGLSLIGGGGNLQWEVLANPYTPVAGTNNLAIVAPTLADTGARVGIVLGNQTSGKFVFAGLHWDGTTFPVFRVEKFNSDGTSAGTLVADSYPMVVANGPVAFSASCSTATLYEPSIGDLSGYWSAQVPFDIGAFLGSADRIGVGCASDYTAPTPGFVSAAWLHWHQGY